MLTTAFLGWWATVEPARRMALIALTLCFFSQFLLYHPNGNYGYAWANGDGGLNTTISFDPPRTGWQEHSLAWLALPALIVMHTSLLRFKPLWAQWGYWVTPVVMLFFGVMTDNTDTWGVRLGLLTVALVGYAIYLDNQARSAAAKTAGQGPS